MQVVDEALAARKTRGKTAADVFRQYFFWLGILPLLFYLTGFVLVRIPSYERWGGSAWGPILDYAFEAKGENADVVIFGDSSALFAVDPVQMSRQLGLKVINLPNTIGGLPVVGDMALRRYLASSRPPRLIVFYFSAWDLDYRSAKGTRLFEGEEMLVRHGSWRQILQFAIRHPHEAFSFPFRVYSGLGPSGLINLFRPNSAVLEVNGHYGHVANRLPYPPLASNCDIPEAHIHDSRTASVGDLIRKYSTGQTRALLYLAPVPGCRNVDALLARIRAQSGLPHPAVYPPRDFTDDSYYAHLRPSVVPATTELVTLFVRSYLASE